MKKIKALTVIVLSFLGFSTLASNLDNDYSTYMKEVSSSGKGVDNHGERACGTRRTK